MNLQFSNTDELLSLCKERKSPISRIMLERELARGERDRAAIAEHMAMTLNTMRASITKGIEEKQNSVTGLTGGDAELLHSFALRSMMGPLLCRAVAASMAVVEVNASMGRIVAAPTAGASGILPGVLVTCGDAMCWSDDQLIMGLFNAGAIGSIIASNATISGAEGGCQAETGSGAAMAASALTELRGGTPAMCVNAAAIALKNVMGLVCDPVAGLVECPCIKRNAIGAANAVLCSDLVLAGIKSIIPLDEAVSAMRSVGRAMSPDLRETANGGLAATPTAKRIRAQLGLDSYE